MGVTIVAKGTLIVGITKEVGFFSTGSCGAGPVVVSQKCPTSATKLVVNRVAILTNAVENGHIYAPKALMARIATNTLKHVYRH